MTVEQLRSQIKELPLDERVELIDYIWETVEHESPADALTEEQKAELRRRMALYKDHPELWVSLEELHRQLRAQKPC
jgi:putative addiction module component (TIGR02574 family)